MYTFIFGCLIALFACGEGNNADFQPVTSGGCQNFTLSVPDGPFLPSDTITITASCSSSSRNGSLQCPVWYVSLGNKNTSGDQDYVLQNVTLRNNNTCVRHMEIQLWNPIHWQEKQNKLSVVFQYPTGVSVKQIIIKKSEDEGLCANSGDCWLADQECSPWTKTCGCPYRQVFIENYKKCVQSVSTLFGSCSYSEQCQGMTAICNYNQCKCSDNYVADLASNKCLYKDRTLGGGCDNSYYSSSCLGSYTHCHNGKCVCDSGYAAYNGICTKGVENSSPSTKAGYAVCLLTFLALLYQSL